MKNNNLILDIFLKPLILALLFITVASCQQEDNLSTGNAADKVVITPQMLKFEDAPFNEDDGVITRSASEVPQIKAVNLGNGIEAQMTLESDTKSDTIFKRAHTRASQPLSNGFYIIRAFQGNTLKGEMKGYINSGVFTPATDSKNCIILDPNQNYDFICYNDKLISNSDGTFSVTQANVKTAYIGRLENTYVSGKTQYISFYMKHVGSRVHLELHSFIPIKHAVSAILTSPNNNVPTSIRLDSKGLNPIATTVTTINKTLTANLWGRTGSSIGIGTSNDYFYLSTIDSKNDNEACYVNTDTTYTWFLPGTPLRQLRLSLPSLSLYGKTAAASTHLYSTDPVLSGFVTKENTTYKLKIRLVYTGFKYLFSDGTVGTLKANPTKTPIAFVVKDNDGTPNSGMAVALKEADLGTTWNSTTHTIEKNKYCSWTENNPYTAPYGQNLYLNKNFITSGAGSTDRFEDNNGYNWTWDSSTNEFPDNPSMPKAQNQSYPAFYYAAHYNPGIPLTGSISTQKWYLPSTGEWQSAFKAMTLEQVDIDEIGSRSPGVGRSGRFDPLIYSFALGAHYNNQGIIVGGPDLTTNMADVFSVKYWTSTFINYAGELGGDCFQFNGGLGWTGNNGTTYPAMYYFQNNNQGSNAWQTISQYKAKVRAFIHF